MHQCGSVVLAKHGRSVEANDKDGPNSVVLNDSVSINIADHSILLFGSKSIITRANVGVLSQRNMVDLQR